MVKKSAKYIKTVRKELTINQTSKIRQLK